jgi:hypothetical protein
MTTTPNMTTAFLAVDMLPSSFREVHGRRPARFQDHADVSAWLDKMATATLVSGENCLGLALTAEKAGDQAEALKMAREGTRYMEAHSTITALQVAA